MEVHVYSILDLINTMLYPSVLTSPELILYILKCFCFY